MLLRRVHVSIIAINSLLFSLEFTQRLCPVHPGAWNGHVACSSSEEPAEFYASVL